MFKQLAIKDRPPQASLDQFLLEISLNFEQIQAAHGLVFEDQEDEMSPVKVSLIMDECENYYLFVARPLFPEISVTVFTIRRSDSTAENFTRMINDFVAMLTFDGTCITARVDEAMLR